MTVAQHKDEQEEHTVSLASNVVPLIEEEDLSKVVGFGDFED